jgi:alkylated DNA repair dioxygenase AlkB
MTRKAGFHENASITKPTDGAAAPPAGRPAPKLHPGYLDRSRQEQLVAELRDIIRQAPLFPPRMPRTGSPFSVRITNCGRLG